MRQTSKYLKGLAREALLQRYSTAVGAYLILFLFTLFRYLLPMQIVLENEIATLLVNQLISLLLTLILFVFQAGAICLILNMSRQREYPAERPSLCIPPQSGHFSAGRSGSLSDPARLPASGGNLQLYLPYLGTLFHHL